MPDVNWLAIVVAAIVVFVLSTVYYMVLSGRLKQLSPVYSDADDTPPPWKIAIEILRSAVVGAVVAGLVSLLGITAVGDAMLLALALWIGFPVVLLIGSVIWEKVPPMLAAIHTGDWLLKLMIISIIVTIWR